MPRLTRRIRRSLLPGSTALAVMVGLMLLPGTASAAPPPCEFNNGATYQVNETQAAGNCELGESGGTVTISQQGTKGTATVTNRGQVSYTASTTGDDTFTVSASDGTTSTPHVVTTHNVAQVNDPAVCHITTPSGFPPAPVTVVGHWRVIATCQDAPNETANVSIVIDTPADPAKGETRIIGNGNHTAELQYRGKTADADSVGFHANDGNSDSATQTFSTTNAADTSNHAPNCEDGTEGSRLHNPIGGPDFTAGVCADGDHDVLDITITQQPAHGVATVVNVQTEDAEVDYHATSAGNDSFKFKANDGTADSNEATVTLCNGDGCVTTTPPPTTKPPTTYPLPTGTTITKFPAALAGGNSGGTVTVSSNGTLTLKRKVDCTGAGPDCAVSDSLSAQLVGASSAAKKKKKAKTVKLGGSKFTVKAGKKGAIKVKLTKKGLKLLKRLHKIKAKLKVTVKRGTVVTKKTLKVTLKAPKAKKKHKK